MMEVEFNHLNHATWECKYHVVFTPKYRKKLLVGKIKRHLGQVFHDLARRKECRIEEGHLMPDHVHMLISIPPKYSVAQIIGYEREEFDMDRAECRTQDAEFSGPQILGSRIICQDRRSGRGGDPGLYPKPRTGRSAIGSVRAEDLSRPESNQSSYHPLKPPLAVPNQTSSFAGGYWLQSLRDTSSWTRFGNSLSRTALSAS